MMGVLKYVGNNYFVVYCERNINQKTRDMIFDEYCTAETDIFMNNNNNDAYITNDSHIKLFTNSELSSVHTSSFSLAWASISNLNQYGRPTSGTINFWPQPLDNNYESLV